MKIFLDQIAHARSGDKGASSNVGLIFYSEEVYEWAKEHITERLVKEHFQEIVKGNVKRYEMDNLLAFNFILEDSLGGGGSDSLLNDPQGKTHGQALMILQIELPEYLVTFIRD